MKNALIIVHRSEKLPRHVAHAIGQAIRVCGQGSVIPMLPPHLAASVAGAVPLTANPKGFDSFAESYRHRHTTQTQGCVLQWFERYYQVRQFLRQHDLDRVVMIDSDVLWYRRLDEFLDLELAGRADIALAIVPPQDPRLNLNAPAIGSGHCLFSRGLQPIEELCSFLDRLFTDPEEIAAADSFWQALNDAGSAGGICDMYALHRYVTAHARSGGWLRTAENNLNASNGFAMRGAIKRFRIRHGCAQLQRQQDHVWTDVSFLHFQGGAKRLMGAARWTGWSGVAAQLALERLTGRRFAG